MVTHDTPSTQIVVRIETQELPFGDFRDASARQGPKGNLVTLAAQPTVVVPQRNRQPQ
jgi:hypothetical protein